MDDRDDVFFRLSNLGTSDDIAIRSYYLYELLNKLVASQQKGLLEEVSIPLGIAASVFSIFGYLENPPSRTLIIIGFALAISIIGGAPIVERRLRGKDSLDDVTYLGIYLDEVSRYVGEIELANKFAQDDRVTELIVDTKDALKGSLKEVHCKLLTLKAKDAYPKCLEKIGRDEAWMKVLDASVRRALDGNGSLFPWGLASSDQVSKQTVKRLLDEECS